MLFCVYELHNLMTLKSDFDGNFIYIEKILTAYKLFLFVVSKLSTE